MPDQEKYLSTSINRAISTLLTINDSLPTLDSISLISEAIDAAEQRGYLKPDEDDKLRELFSQYLRCRTALLETIHDLRPVAQKELRKKTPEQPAVFLISYAASILLLRAAHVLIDTFKDSRLAINKLNEAEPRFGIPRKQFTQIYRSATSVRNLWAFIQAKEYWNKHKADFIEQLSSQQNLNPIIALIERDQPFIESETSRYTEKRFRYRLHSFLRRNHSGFKQASFALFEVSGRLISELKLSIVPRRKRISPKVRKKLANILQAGDLIITRHDDALTNLFLPGFWPHAALYIGTDTQRKKIGLNSPLDELENNLDPICTLEALKDGVHTRRLSQTLSVDACVILRPKLESTQIREAIERGLAHEGKEYDFEFDFRRSDKLVCTEVIYRAYHQIGGIDFELSTRSGRVCLSAEDLLDHCYGNNPYFDVVALFGYKGNRLVMSEDAKVLLHESYKSNR